MLFRIKSSQHRYCYLLAQCYIPIIIFISLFNLNFVLPLIVYISCKHFARGTYVSDNEEGRIMKNEEGVEELGYELERLERSVDKEKKGVMFILYGKAMLASFHKPYMHKEDLQAIF